MRLAWIVAGSLVVGLGLMADPQDLRKRHRSYGVGFHLGENVREGLALEDIGANPDLVLAGFADGLKDREPALPTRRLDAILSDVQEEMQARTTKRLLEESPAFQTTAAENLSRSRAFHEAFGREEGVVTLPSGTQYKITRPGTGPVPEPGDVVALNVRLALLDGTEIGRWNNSSMRVDQVIAGGAEVLPRMKVGAKWQTAFPPQLAFGEEGRYPTVGPNETLLADVERLEIKSPSPPAPLPEGEGGQ